MYFSDKIVNFIRYDSKSVGYANDQMTSFFICDDDWEKGKEVTLEEMDDNPEIDSWVMKDRCV